MRINCISGVHPFPVRLAEEIEIQDDAPFYIMLGIAIGNASWYKDPPSHRLAYADKLGIVTTKFCPMRGSRLGITAMLNVRGMVRVHEYHYYFAGYFARFCARKMTRTGKRILAFDAKKEPLFSGSLGTQQARCAHDIFISEFARSIGAGGNEVMVRYSRPECKLIVISGISDKESKGAIFHLCHLWSITQ